jgi:hypothetical protein
VAVAVSDGGGETVPIVNEPTNRSIGGRGLGIVARLSLRWGVCVDDAQWESDPPANGQAAAKAEKNGHWPSDRGPGEHTVWAEVPVRYGSPTSLVTASSRETLSRPEVHHAGRGRTCRLSKRRSYAIASCYVAIQPRTRVNCL